MKKIVLYLLLLLYCKTGMPQTCEEKAAQTQGKWIKGNAPLGYVQGYETMTPVIKTGRAKMLSLMDSITAMIKKVLPQPVGFDGRITRNIWSCSDVDSAYGGYEWYSHYFDYYCANGTIKKADETNINFRISVNVLNREDFLRKQYFFEPYGIPLYTVPPAAGSVQGFPAYQMYSYGSAERYAVLITRDPASLPFIPVTKREFYALVRNCINLEKETTKKNIIKNTKIRPTAELQAALQKRMDEIDNSSLGQDAKNARKRRLQQDFRTDEDMLKDKLNRVDKQYEEYLQKLDEMEKTFKNELNTPFYVKEYEFSLNLLNTSYNNQHLFNDSLQGYMMIKPNPGYFKKTNEKWKPQFLLAAWRKDNNYGYSRQLDLLWRNKLDFEKLKSLLVK